MNPLDETLAAIEREVRKLMALPKWNPCVMGGTLDARIHKIAINIVQISGVRGDKFAEPKPEEQP